MDSVRIPLTQGKFALVDAEDASQLSAHKWHAVLIHRAWYAATHGSSGRIYMHKFLLVAPTGFEVDHINGDGLDNRRSVNLRLATHQQNLANQRLNKANTSGYRGVIQYKYGPGWVAWIKINQRKEHLGVFDHIETAAYARDLRALGAFGPYAALNLLKSTDDLDAVRALVEAERRKFSPSTDAARRANPHPRAKITREIADAIRLDAAQSRSTHKELAARHGTSWTTVRDVLQGRSWKPTVTVI